MQRRMGTTSTLFDSNPSGGGFVRRHGGPGSLRYYIRVRPALFWRRQRQIGDSQPASPGPQHREPHHASSRRRTGSPSATLPLRGSVRNARMLSGILAASEAVPPGGGVELETVRPDRAKRANGRRRLVGWRPIVQQRKSDPGRDQAEQRGGCGLGLSPFERETPHALRRSSTSRVVKGERMTSPS